MNAGDVGKGGITVTLTKPDTTTTTTTTAGDGTYTFSGLAKGVYSVTYSVPTNWADTSPTNPIAVTLVYGGSFTGKNFFLQQQDLAISGSVIDDVNADESASGDTALTAANATVRLYLDTNNNGTYNAGTDQELTAKGSPVTTAAGLWSFGSLTPGTYFVIETDPTNYVSTNATPAGNKISNSTLKVVLVAADSTGNAFLDALSTSTVSG